MYLITNSAKLIVEICNHPCYVRRQSNGVVILSDQEHADAIYSNDSDTFWPIERVGYLCDSHTLVEVESVPNNVVAGYYFYHAGEFYTTEANLSALAKARTPELANIVFVKLAETEARSKSNTHRLDHLEKSTEAINRLATSVEVMAKEQKHQTEAIKEVKTDLSDLSGKVEKIEAEPGNRWKTLVEKVILLVTAAVVGYILARVGL